MCACVCVCVCMHVCVCVCAHTWHVCTCDKTEHNVSRLRQLVASTTVCSAQAYLSVLLTYNCEDVAIAYPLHLCMYMYM